MRVPELRYLNIITSYEIFKIKPNSEVLNASRIKLAATDNI